MAVVQYPFVADSARPRVSVCIANFNGEALLPACLDSVLVQDTDAGIEIIVHDDASHDASVSLLRSRYPQAHVLASEENVGFCIGNNRMVAQARGEYILLLNNDAALAPDAIRHLLHAASSIGGPAILTLPQVDWETGVLVDRGCLLDPFHNPIPNLDPDRDDVAYVIGACLWIPRADWNQLGGFPEWFGSIAEDMYLCCLARLHGIPVRVVDADGYRHRQGASFGGNRIDGGRIESSYRRRALSERNKTTVLLTCTPSRLVWGLLALHLSALAIEGMSLALLKRDPRLWREVYAPSISHVFRNWRPLVARRQQAQSGRRCGLNTYMHAFRWIPWKLVMLTRHGLPTVR